MDTFCRPDSNIRGYRLRVDLTSVTDIAPWNGPCTYETRRLFRDLRGNEFCLFEDGDRIVYCDRFVKCEVCLKTEDSPLTITTVHPTSFSIPERRLYSKIDTFPDAEIPDLTHRHDFGSSMRWEKIRSENLSVDYGILLSEVQCQKYLTLLESEIRYYEGDLARVKIFGKWHPIPRQQVAFGDPGLVYRFSGNCIPAKEWTNTILELKTMVENATGFRYNFVLVNRYRDGNSYIGEHRDDEDEIDKDTPIASLSLGVCREFQFKHADLKKGKRQRTDIPVVKKMLGNGSLLLMNPPTNSYWYHSLPKRPGCKSLRINLTFRNIITPSK